LSATDERTECAHGHDWFTYGQIRTDGTRHCRECHRLCQEAKAHPMPVRTEEQRAAKRAQFDADMRKRYKSWRRWHD